MEQKPPNGDKEQQYRRLLVIGVALEEENGSNRRDS